MKKNTKMILRMPRSSYIKMIQYARAVESEISGLANVTLDAKKKLFTMGPEVYLLEQEAGGATVALVEDAVHHFLVDLIKQGVTQTPRIWWHSHYNFEPFFSGVDDATIARLKTDTFIVAICVNQQGNLSAKALITKPKGENDLIVDLDIKIFPTFPSLEPTDEIKAEVATKVKEKKWEVWKPVKDFLKGDNKWNGGVWDQDECGRYPLNFRHGETALEGDKETEIAGVHYLPSSRKKRDRFIRRKHLTPFFSIELDEWAHEDQFGNIYLMPSNHVFGKKQC